MKRTERNRSPDHSTKWSQSMARRRPWFLGQGSKRSRLDEDRSSSKQTVNSRCSEIDPNTTERSPPFSGGERSTKEKEPFVSRFGLEEERACWISKVPAFSLAPRSWLDGV